jgi:hypothetical protein
MTSVIPFDFVELVLCYFYVGRCDDPTYVHFIFKCKIINNALILGELSYIHYNTLFVLISIGIGCLEDKSFLFGTLCAIIKSVESLVCLFKPCFLWELVISFLVIYFLLLKWDMLLSMCVLVMLYAHWLLRCSLGELWSQFCVDLIIWYNLDNLLSLHNFMCSHALLGVLSKLYLFWALESIVHAYLLNVYLMTCFAFFDQIYRGSSIKS